MGNVLLIKIKENSVVKAIDAIQVAQKNDNGGLIHHHRLNLENFSWQMNSADMLDELRALMFETVDELNDELIKTNKAQDAMTGPNSLQFNLFNSIIKRIKRVYAKSSVDKVSYLVQDEKILNDGSLPVMDWVSVPKK